jgi:hypothetical protein
MGTCFILGTKENTKRMCVRVCVCINLKGVGLGKRGGGMDRLFFNHRDLDGFLDLNTTTTELHL